MILSGYDIPHDEKNLKEVVKEFALGFSIEVKFNDDILSNTFASNGKHEMLFTETEVGLICCPMLTDVKNGGKANPYNRIQTATYLQGLPVLNKLSWRFESVTIIHLDSKKFNAKMPDRSELIDANEVQKLIDKQVTKYYKEFILADREGLTDVEFCKKWFRVSRLLGVSEIFNNIDAAPAEALLVPEDDLPNTNTESFRDYFEDSKECISKQDIIDGTVKVCALEELCDISDEKSVSVAYQIAKTLDWYVINPDRIDGGHWLHDHLINFYPGKENSKGEKLPVCTVSVQMINKLREVSYELDRRSGNIFVAESVDLIAYDAYGALIAECRNVKVPAIIGSNEDDRTGCADIYLSNQMGFFKSYSEVICQVLGNYNDEYGSLDNDTFVSDINQLNQQFDYITDRAPEEILREMLINLSFSNLRNVFTGKSFEVSFDKDMVLSVKNLETN